MNYLCPVKQIFLFAYLLFLFSVLLVFPQMLSDLCISFILKTEGHAAVLSLFCFYL